MDDSPFFRVYNGEKHLKSRKVVGFYNKYLSDMKRPLYRPHIRFIGYNGTRKRSFTASKQKKNRRKMEIERILS